MEKQKEDMPVSEDIDLGVMTDSEVSGDIDLLSDDALLHVVHCRVVIESPDAAG